MESLIRLSSYYMVIQLEKLSMEQLPSRYLTWIGSIYIKKRKMVYLIHCFKPNNLVFALLSSLSRMIVSEVNTLFR